MEYARKTQKKSRKRNRKRVLALLLAVAVIGTGLPLGSLTQETVEAATKTVNTTRYKISKKAGTYTGTVKVKLTAKKGYKLYYTWNNVLSVKKVLNSGKSKTFTVSKTKSLVLYAVKKNTKVTTKKLKKAVAKKLYKTYKYKIKTSSASSSSGSTATNTGSSASSSSGSATGTGSTSTTSGSSTASSSTGTNSTSADSSSSATATTATESSYTATAYDTAGTYTLSGAQTAQIYTVNKSGAEVTDTVTIVLDNVTIDNSSLTCDKPVISIGKNTSNVVIYLKGSNKLIGPSAYASEPASGIIRAAGDTTVTFRAEDGATLTIKDSMTASTDFGDNDPTDGIFAKGALVFESGTYSITSCGACLKGSGSSGIGGVTISGGSFSLCSYLSNGIRSKDGVISISGGSVATTYTAEDAIHANHYAVNISGGTVAIDKCYGDGIQGEEVNISGGNTNITTYYEYAGVNFYSGNSLGVNTLSSSDSQKSETINYDTGSHCGIKAGTKACTYKYTTVASGSSNTAGTPYTPDASGGLMISGGTVTIDTTNTGIKYNGGTSGSGFMSLMAVPGGGSSGPGGGNSGPGGGNTPGGNGGGMQGGGGDSQTILGSPGDGIHSNNTAVISGGTVTISAADDGLASAGTLTITGGAATVKVLTAYEGIEAGTITVGTKDSATGPSVSVYTNDDGINAASKTSVEYVYADESKTTYTKTAVKNTTGNNMTVYSGTVYVEVADDQSHSYELANALTGGTVTGTFSADGDGIDCNGSFYGYGGTVLVYGPTNGGNSAIDTGDGSSCEYVIGSGVTLFAIGSTGMVESPTSATQAYINTNVSVGSGVTVAIKSGSETLFTSDQTKKSSGNIQFSSPELTSGTSYTITYGSSSTSATATTK